MLVGEREAELNQSTGTWYVWESTIEKSMKKCCDGSEDLRQSDS